MNLTLSNINEWFFLVTVIYIIVIEFQLNMLFTYRLLVDISVLAYFIGE